MWVKDIEENFSSLFVGCVRFDFVALDRVGRIVIISVLRPFICVLCVFLIK